MNMVKINKGSMGNRELSHLSQTAIGFNGWIRKSLCNRLKVGNIIMVHSVKWTLCFVAIIIVSQFLSLSVLAQDNPVSVKYDFETGDLQGWKVVEGKFGKLLCNREVFLNSAEKYNKQGSYYLSTLEDEKGNPNDGFAGIIESPLFLLQKPYVSFLVGGGNHVNTYVAMCTAKGKEVFKASGAGTEVMRRVEWDAKEYVGQRVFLRVVDKNTGRWGHVTFDDLVLETTGEYAAQLEADRKKREAERAAKLRRDDERRQKKTEAFLADDRLFARGQTKLYRGEHLGAIDFTVGGIGSGCIRYDGKAKPFVWQIFNNSTQAFVPHSFLAVRAKTRNDKVVIRALQTEAVGPFQAMKELQLRAEYPFACYDFVDSEMPVQVRMEVFNPMIPLDEKNSGIPCVIINLTAENKSQQTVDISYLAAQQNAVGFTGRLKGGSIKDRSYEGYGGNINEVVQKEGATILHMTSNKSRDARGYGDMALAVLHDRQHVSTSASWQDFKELMTDFADNGALSGDKTAGPSPAGQTLDGALATGLSLKPGDTKTVTLILSWYFPNGYHGSRPKNWDGEGGDMYTNPEPLNWGGEGNMYTNWWTNALDVTGYLKDNLNEFSRLTHLYHDTFYATNLPYWLLDRITSQMAILRGKTCFWTQDGYFGVWEGCSQNMGSCVGNCNHVWQYAQGHARLFPEIGRLMRQEVFSFQKDSGSLPHRQPVPERMWYNPPNYFPTFDGQCGDILGAYREHLMSKDDKWLKHYWPHIKKAMDYTIVTWDKDEDGDLFGSGPKPNTLDSNLGGSSAWLGSLYLAALAATEKMALLQNEPEAAKRYRCIRESGSQKQDETLWNGEYYVQIPGRTPQRDYQTGCVIDQLVGQWWANQLDLGWFYPPDRVQSAMRSVFKYNFKSDFHGITQVPRIFVADDDMGLQMITWPRGNRPEKAHCTRYADEVMTGFEYAAAAAMVQAGAMKEGFAVVKAVSDRHDGRLRKNLTPGNSGGWGYSGNPFGDDECGKFYGRALSVWSMLLTCQGFIHDGPADVIGFKPLWKPEDHRSFFTASEGWGLFTQKRNKDKQTGCVEIAHGKLTVREWVSELPTGKQPSQVTVEAAGQKVAASFSFSGNRLTIELAEPVTITAGQKITVVTAIAE
jgi:non-lysosomal glucosylceramidase